MTKPVYSDAYATLRFHSDTLDPMLVTALLRLPPDHTHRNGEQTFRRTRSGAVVEAQAPFKQGMWTMSSQDHVMSPRLETHIAWILAQIEPKAETVRSLIGEGVKGDIFCYSVGSTSRPPALPRAMRQRAEALGLFIDIDHYQTERAERS